jgi:hypothetical protein
MGPASWPPSCCLIGQGLRELVNGRLPDSLMALISQMMEMIGTVGSRDVFTEETRQALPCTNGRAVGHASLESWCVSGRRGLTKPSR